MLAAPRDREGMIDWKRLFAHPGSSDAVLSRPAQQQPWEVKQVVNQIVLLTRAISAPELLSSAKHQSPAPHSLCGWTVVSMSWNCLLACNKRLGSSSVSLRTRHQPSYIWLFKTSTWRHSLKHSCSAFSRLLTSTHNSSPLTSSLFWRVPVTSLWGSFSPASSNTDLQYIQIKGHMKRV